MHRPRARSSARAAMSVLVWLFAITCCATNDAVIPHGQHSLGKAVLMPGDVILGGLFPVHGSSQDARECGRLDKERGLQRLEAMLYAIERVNAEPTILPSIRLGAHVRDTCGSDTHALEESLAFVKALSAQQEALDMECRDKTMPIYRQSGKGPPVSHQPVAAVIGASGSRVSIQVTNLLRLFSIPQISYASTSPALSDKNRYDFFARTVPSDVYQVEAMIAIIQYFNWSFVSTVASFGEYGQNGISEFEKRTRAMNICISVSETLPPRATPSDFHDVINSLTRKKTNARVVIVFVDPAHVKPLLSAATERGFVNHFIWIGSDGWGRAKVDPKDMLTAEGAITIELETVRNSDFQTYLVNRLKRTDFSNDSNPWFAEYWRETYGCTLPSMNMSNGLALDVPHCSAENISNVQKGLSVVADSKVHFVEQAVYVFALAFHRLLGELCHGKLCRAIDGRQIYDAIINASFSDSRLLVNEVGFDENGDGTTQYLIMNYKRNRSTDEFEYEKVGTWHKGVLQIEPAKMVWAGGSSPYHIPKSVCSEPCGLGEAKNLQQGSSCCWVCTPCMPRYYLKDEYTCIDCGERMWPTALKNDCYQLEEQYISWQSVYAILPLVISFVGILCTVFVILTFVRYRDTPIVKASGRELCYIILSGCIAAYLVTVPLLLKPTAVSCALVRIGTNMSFAVIYSALLVKTNRIARIFYHASRSAKMPPLVSPRSQIVITGGLVGIQAAITAIWLVMEPPGTRHLHPNDDLSQLVLKCKMQDRSFMISLCFVMVLIVTCTFFAFQTRRVPANFAESKFIGFTMYTTCVIWLSFVPMFFGTLNSVIVQTLTLCVSISCSATVCLACLFGPKLYVIYFQPEKNMVKKIVFNRNLQHRPSFAVQHLAPRPEFGIELHRANSVIHQRLAVSTTSGDSSTTTCHGNSQHTSGMRFGEDEVIEAAVKCVDSGGASSTVMKSVRFEDCCLTISRSDLKDQLDTDQVLRSPAPGCNGRQHAPAAFPADSLLLSEQEVESLNKAAVVDSMESSESSLLLDRTVITLTELSQPSIC